MLWNYTNSLTLILIFSAIFNIKRNINEQTIFFCKKWNSSVRSIAGDVSVRSLSQGPLPCGHSLGLFRALFCWGVFRALFCSSFPHYLFLRGGFPFALWPVLSPYASSQRSSFGAIAHRVFPVRSFGGTFSVRFFNGVFPRPNFRSIFQALFWSGFLVNSLTEIFPVRSLRGFSPCPIVVRHFSCIVSKQLSPIPLYSRGFPFTLWPVMFPYALFRRVFSVDSLIEVSLCVLLAELFQCTSSRGSFRDLIFRALVRSDFPVSSFNWFFPVRSYTGAVSVLRFCRRFSPAIFRLGIFCDMFCLGNIRALFRSSFPNWLFHRGVTPCGLWRVLFPYAHFCSVLFYGLACRIFSTALIRQSFFTALF